MLGEPDVERSLREVLKGLLAEVEAEIGHLEERRERIAELLAGEHLEAPPPSPTFEMFMERLGEHLPEEASAEVWEQEERLWAALDAYDWPEGYRETWEAVARYYAERPEEHRQLVAFGERVAALANEPADSPEVERLARECVGFLGSNPGLAELSEQPLWARGPFGQVMSDLLAANLSPAQRRFIELANEYGSRGDEQPHHRGGEL